MNIITIPKKLASKGDLVVIPRKDYEEFLQLRRAIPMVRASRAELRAIERSEKEISEGKYISWHELKRELAHRRDGKRKKTN